MGLPGLALALLLQLTVREPRRGHLDAAPGVPAEVPLGQTLRGLWRLPSFRGLTIGAGLASFAGTGFGAWVPTLFVRVHGMTLAEVGDRYAWHSVPAALVGTLLTGWIADRMARRDPRWLLGVSSLGVALSRPFLMGICLWPDEDVAMRYSLVIVLSTSLVGAVLLGVAARHYLRDVSALRGASAAAGSDSQR